MTIRDKYIDPFTDFLALDKDKQFIYQQDLKARWDNQACLDFAKESGMEKGIQKGIQQGIQQGIEQGIEKGIEQGIEQGIEKEKKESKKKIIEIAKSLLDVLDSETIALKTGLSVEEIEELRGL